MTYTNKINKCIFYTSTGWYIHTAELGKMYFVSKSR